MSSHRPCAHGRVPDPERVRARSPFGVGFKLWNPLKQACFVLAVLIAAPGVASGLQAREPLQDWDRVHQLRPGSRVAVKLLKGMGSKTADGYESSDEGGIVLHSPAGLRRRQFQENAFERSYGNAGCGGLPRRVPPLGSGPARH